MPEKKIRAPEKKIPAKAVSKKKTFVQAENSLPPSPSAAGKRLRVCPREDQAQVTHATSPISLKLSQMIKVIKLFKNPK